MTLLEKVMLNSTNGIPRVPVVELTNPLAVSVSATTDPLCITMLHT